MFLLIGYQPNSIIPFAFESKSRLNYIHDADAMAEYLEMGCATYFGY